MDGKDGTADGKATISEKGFAAGQPSVNVGWEIKALRKAKRWTLERLAEEAQCSVGLLSQVERGKSSASIKTVQKISAALGVNIGWFLPAAVSPPAEELGQIVRRNAIRHLSYGPDIKDALLTPSMSGKLEVLESTFAPGASSGKEPYSHDGEEAGVVLSGQFALWIDGRTFHLDAGDCFYFESVKPHKYWNPGDQETVIIWVITPPTF